MDQVYFSVLIPVYNTACWLPECLNSLLSQTISDWECICIDDGSTDDSWKILQIYAQKDHRIKIFQQDNQGASSARNNALNRVTGKYFTFLDSDDVISHDMLAVWKTFLEKTHADILMEEGKPKSFVHRKEIESVLSRSLANIPMTCKTTQEAFKYYHTELLSPGVAMLGQRAYLTKRLGQHRFDETLEMSEDSYYFYQFFNSELTWCFLAMSSYFYRNREGSAVHTLTPKKRLNNLEITVKRLEMLAQFELSLAECRNFWEMSRNNLEYRVRGPNDCWNRLSKVEKAKFMDAVNRAYKVLGYYPFDFIMRIRLQFLRGHCEWIPRLMEYLYMGTKKRISRIFDPLLQK